MIKKYLVETINLGRFRVKFLKIQNEDEKEARKILGKDFKQLSTFLINLKLNEFSFLINQIFGDYVLAYGFSPKNNYEITENHFRNFIEKVFFQMQNLFDK